MKPFFSVVIPIYNLRPTIELLLRCLEAQTLANEQFECILVDDGSTDGCSALLKNYQPDINLKRRFNTVNLGRSQTRNVGWREAEGEYVIFLDGDMLPAPEWLAGFREEVTRNPAEVISGGRYSIDVGSRTGDLTQRLASLTEANVEDLFCRNISRQFQTLHESARLGPYPNVISEKLETQLREVCRAHPESMLCAYSFITSNIAVRTRALKKTSGFSPFLRRGEDTDLGLRLWEMGARFGFAEGARAYHLFDSRQPDRGISLAERLAFFYRHPYSPNLMIAFWTAYNSPGAPPAPFPIFNTLQSIAGGGKELRKKDLSNEFYQLYRRPVPANCQYTKSEITEYFHEVSGISPQQMGQYLDLALEKELFIVEKNNEIYFDINHTSNWLKRATPYQEYELRHASYGRTRKTAFQKSGDKADLTSIQCKGTYELSISVRGREQILKNAALSIPTPVENVYQSDVRIGETVPEKLMSFYDPKTKVITFPLKELNCGEEINISYEFSCKTHEFTTLDSGVRASQESPTPEHRSSTLPLEYKRKAEAMLKKIVPATIDDPYRIAKRIYNWILNNTSYLQSPPTPHFLIFDTGFGSCVHMAGMFVNLCRLAQIPARERSCALFLQVDESEGLIMKNLTRGYTPFTHAWAEFYVSEREWVPVDFLSWGYGGRVLSALNVVDDALRAEIENDTEIYDEYYFGGMDPYRIHVSETAGKAQFLTVKQTAVNDATMQEILSQTRHRLSCEFSTLGR